jgi:hypothetical protein
MLIVFGIRHFKIKSYSAAELGLTDPAWQNTRFEAVQKYFHLMYIPFFPVGKMIGTRGADGELYHLHPQVAAHISKYQLKHKTPWYSWLAPILGISGFIFFLASLLIGDHYRAIKKEKNLAEFNAEITAMIDHPSLNDYYRLAIDTDAVADGYVGHQVRTLFRVIDFNETQIQFRSAAADPFEYCSGYDPAQWPSCFKDTTNYNAFWLKKADLKKAMIPSVKEEYNYDGALVSAMGKSLYIIIDDVHIIDGPEFSAYYRMRSSGGEATIRVTNDGDTATNVSFTKASGEGSWLIEDNAKVNPTESFTLRTESGSSDNFAGKIQCTGTNGKRYTFVISVNPEDNDQLIVKKLK